MPETTIYGEQLAQLDTSLKASVDALNDSGLRLLDRYIREHQKQIAHEQFIAASVAAWQKRLIRL